MTLFIRRTLIVFGLVALCSGCIGAVIGQTTNAAVEVAKVPFKVGGAVVDVANGDDDKKKDKKGD